MRFSIALLGSAGDSLTLLSGRGRTRGEGPSPPPPPPRRPLLPHPRSSGHISEIRGYQNNRAGEKKAWLSPQTQHDIPDSISTGSAEGKRHKNTLMLLNLCR